MRDIIRHGLARLGLVQPSVSQWAAAHRELPKIIDGGASAPELCMKPIDVPEKEGAWNFPGVSVVQLKADGVRALYIDGRVVTMEGVPLDCAGHCVAGLKRLEQHYGEPMMFDGEYVEDGGFNATISAMRKAEGHGVVWLFDAVPMSEWRGDTCRQPIERRLDRLAQALPHAESQFVGMLDHWRLGPTETVEKAQELFALGYEGVVGKRAGSLYQRRRSADWFRIKAAFTSDCVVMDAIVKNGVLKSLMCKTPDGQTMRVSTGWDRATMATLLELCEAGRMPVVEVKWNPATGGGYRGAVFQRLRFDKETTR